jgi:hypothetical protein
VILGLFFPLVNLVVSIWQGFSAAFTHTIYLVVVHTMGIPFCLLALSYKDIVGIPFEPVYGLENQKYAEWISLGVNFK